ncbi:GNAT family protein [uncultured Croceitalea sp.]|uniref:GNAT family N-acetyltransferase n=1 Tax=uncultured Croceitalea sp. TaxID=1798908 RepID=UPI0033058F61
MNIEFKKLGEIEKSNIVDLMNNSLVRKQMPLLRGVFNEIDCDRFITSKEQMWEEHGYGPWAFVINNEFAGWGGIQPDNGEADLALVLHPDYWGMGKTIYKEIISRAFNELGLSSVQVLFPPSRTRIKGLLRLGFKKEVELKIANERFIRYRLNKTDMGPSKK